MYLLSREGSRHFLEFLRNLTPQVLFLSTTFILYFWWRRSPTVYLYFALFITTACVCIAAIVANANNFLDNAFSQSVAIAAERDRVKETSETGRASISQIIKYIWNEKRSAVYELAIALACIYGALFAILVTALVTASRALK